MSSRKRQRRQNELVDQYESHIRQKSESAVLSSKSDNDLFTVDRVGSKSAKRKIAKQEVAKSEARSSLSESTLIQKVLSGKVLSTRRRNHFQVNGGNADNSLDDIWANEPLESSPKIARNPKKKLRIAKPGQSYNPAVDDHQDVAAEALALQIQKEEKEAKLDAVHAQLTQPRYLIEDDDVDDGSDDASVESAADDLNDSAEARKSKQNQKLTQAQRNKIKRRKESEYYLKKEKQEKLFLKSIDNLPRIIHEINKAEAENETKQLIRQEHKKEKESENLALSYDEAGAIPLSDELKGSLRCLLPKGSSLKNQVERFRSTDELIDKTFRKPTLFDKRHKGKKIKWVAKYKYT
mmetsp:Transcript_18644/g.18735  ORF Transcript_18644/g.18735 Transcript_18644/m.18735 type:complete len:351 (+) Transcript_18644:41-1093(+)